MKKHNYNFPRIPPIPRIPWNRPGHKSEENNAAKPFFDNAKSSNWFKYDKVNTEGKESIDLLFTLGVHSSLHPNCHHHIIFAKFNLQIFYPPHYKEPNTDLTRCVVNNFNWERAYTRTNINQKVEIFSKAILNILSNFIRLRHFNKVAKQLY